MGFYGLKHKAFSIIQDTLFKYSTYRMLNRRHQKRSMKYSKFLRIWNYYVKEPHVTTNIWDWKPKNA